MKNLKIKVSNYYKENFSILSLEEREAFDFFLYKGFYVFPYSWCDNYNSLKFRVGINRGLPCADVFGKKMFFKKGWSELQVNSYLRGIYREQDLNSPHRYITDYFHPIKEDLVLDIGVAEGYFSLDVINNVSKILAFELDNTWDEPLKQTFKDYAQKIEIFNFKVTDTIKSISERKIDDFSICFTMPIFVKIDVEGDEMKVLNGMKEILKINKKVNFTIACYHYQNQAQEIADFFKSINFKYEFSNNFMFYVFDKNLKEPFLRRGVIRASNYIDF
ncbi:MAG: FkbM family methyltransferase [Algoriphagus sp.]|uniref:FkbM family methyltransferase n=1 Tax=Algoriphagus sp. TaxID=1872435 RepID=UPI00273605A6|nr:FkbM family methyltransferase [Algoriphagus sp.]MDP3200388.1 FkbM family methyltransferase [Algoriphagus sp.]